MNRWAKSGVLLAILVIVSSIQSMVADEDGDSKPPPSKKAGKVNKKPVNGADAKNETKWDANNPPEEELSEEDYNKTLPNPEFVNWLFELGMDGDNEDVTDAPTNKDLFGSPNNFWEQIANAIFPKNNKTGSPLGSVLNKPKGTKAPPPAEEGDATENVDATTVLPPTRVPKKKGLLKPAKGAPKKAAADPVVDETPLAYK